MEQSKQCKSPAANLRWWDAASLIVGIIIGVGIYYTPSRIFSYASSPAQALLLWAVGGFLCLLGAFCFAELASTYPRSGGEYVYLSRAFGPGMGFLFAWGQLAVVRTGGSIGPVAYAFAHYSGRLFGSGEQSSSDNVWYPCLVAAGVVVVLTAVNIIGVRFGKVTQNSLTALKVLGIGGILLVGFFLGRGAASTGDAILRVGILVQRDRQAFVLRQIGQEDRTFFPEKGVTVSIDGQERGPDGKLLTLMDLSPGMRITLISDAKAPAEVRKISARGSTPWYGLAMGLVLVLWTYAGWHEAAYVAAEVHDKQRALPLALITGTGLVIVLYLAINAAYLVGLGFFPAGRAGEIAADVLSLAFDGWGAKVMSALVMLSCIGALNGMIFTTARIYSEMGSDHPLFAPLGRWHATLGTPVLSLLAQGILNIAFIVFVVVAFPKAEDPFEILVKCTAAVFWIFFLLTGIAYFVLRRKDKDIHRPFTAPLYPLTPLIFCACCAGMIAASFNYGPIETFVGLGILLVGVPLYLVSKRLVRRI